MNRGNYPRGIGTPPSPANNDYIIKGDDFGILSLSYRLNYLQEGYDARADFDRNGIVKGDDFGMLSVNYRKNSPIDITPH